MSHQTSMQFIRGRFLTEIQTPQAFPVEYTNDVTRDKDGNVVDGIGADTPLWARLTIKPTRSIRVEMGEPGRFRNPGLIIIQCFVPLQSGSKDLYDLADLITTAFRSTVRDGIIYKRVDVEEAAREQDGWWQLNVTIPYSYDN